MLLAATLLRRHPRLIHLALLAIAALLAARLVSALGALALAAVPTNDVEPRSATLGPLTPAAAERDFDSARALALFGVERAARPSELVDVARTCEEADDTGLPLRLVGSAVFVEPALGLASIVVDERGGGVAEVYARGDLIGEVARLVEVAIEHACIENLSSGAFERVGTVAPVVAGGGASRPAATQASKSAAPGPTGDRVLDAILTGARATPRFEHGKLTGVKLSGIRPGSLYAEAGFNNGDVVVAVNGFTADDPGRALELWARLKDRPTLEVSVLRRGAPLALTVAMPAP